MHCKRCQCTVDQPCPGGCAWVLPDLCSSCVTPDEAAITVSFRSMVDDLREELQQDRRERFILAVAQGVAANTNINADSCGEKLYARRVLELAEALLEAEDFGDDHGEDDEDAATERPSRLVRP